MYISRSREETLAFGRNIARECNPGTIIALSGPLGAGKTTLVQGLAGGLGIKEVVTSPTFIIIAEYEGPLPLYHFDLYRLSGIEEFENLGAGDLLYGSGVSVIEWSERISSILPRDCISVSIEITGPEEREFTLEGPAI